MGRIKAQTAAIALQLGYYVNRKASDRWPEKVHALGADDRLGLGAIDCWRVINESVPRLSFLKSNEHTFRRALESWPASAPSLPSTRPET